MVQKIRFQNKILFEIETINGIKFIKKKDIEASKKAGKPVFCIMAIDEILKGDKEVINLK